MAWPNGAPNESPRVRLRVSSLDPLDFKHTPRPYRDVVQTPTFVPKTKTSKTHRKKTRHRLRGSWKETCDDLWLRAYSAILFLMACFFTCWLVGGIWHWATSYEYNVTSGRDPYWRTQKINITQSFEPFWNQHKVIMDPSYNTTLIDALSAQQDHLAQLLAQLDVTAPSKNKAALQESASAAAKNSQDVQGQWAKFRRLRIRAAEETATQAQAFHDYIKNRLGPDGQQDCTGSCLRSNLFPDAANGTAGYKNTTYGVIGIGLNKMLAKFEDHNGYGKALRALQKAYNTTEQSEKLIQATRLNSLKDNGSHAAVLDRFRHIARDLRYLDDLLRGKAAGAATRGLSRKHLERGSVVFVEDVSSVLSKWQSNIDELREAIAVLRGQEGCWTRFKWWWTGEFD